MSETEIVDTCRVCQGDIVSETTHEYRGDPMNMIIGPGSHNQMTTIITKYCRNCGIQYARLPSQCAKDADAAAKDNQN